MRAGYKKWIKIGIMCEAFLLVLIIAWMGGQRYFNDLQQVNQSTEEDYIKWVDFNVTLFALEKAYVYDVESQSEKVPLNWITLLAYTATKTGGDFSNSKTVVKEMGEAVEKIRAGKGNDQIFTKEYKNYDYFLEAYTAVLGGLVGSYEIEEIVEEEVTSQETKLGTETGSSKIDSNTATGSSITGSSITGSSTTGSNTTSSSTTGSAVKEEKKTTTKWVKKYGLKGFSPLAKGFDYSDFDDFGVSRSYGYKRQHLGHDMMGQIGTPVIAVESGTVEALGWNQYGGWRIGIRSFDKKRYYYYAHLRQNIPFADKLEEGSVVTAGDVIGYLGHTGYSKTENVNNINTPHLHFGIQLIFDESQKEGNNEIWVDCYALVRFLRRNRSETMKVEGTKHWTRVRKMRE